MDSQVIPAEGTGQYAGSEAATTPVTTEAANDGQSGEPASPTASSQPTPPAPAQPDLATLLSDAELRRELFKHPEVAKELDHRASSEAGRRVQAERERWQQQETYRQAQEAARQERERLAQMDEYEAGVYAKQQWAQQDAEEALQARLKPLQREAELRYLSETGEQVFGTVETLAQEAGATPDEMAQLAPSNYPSLPDYIKGAIKFLGTREGKRLAKDMAKTEAAAIVEERLGEQRGQTTSPTVMPPGEGAMTDSDFLAQFPLIVHPTKADYERARRLTGR